MFTRLLFPIFSFASVGGVAVGFSKYNNEASVAVDSLGYKNNYVSEGISSTEQEKINFFYSVVEASGEIQNIQNIKCTQAQPAQRAKIIFTCSLFDFADSKNSTSLISGIEQKINNQPLNLSLVTAAQNKKHYLLRTEIAIENTITRIGIKKGNTDETIGVIDLENGWEKNIQKTN